MTASKRKKAMRKLYLEEQSALEVKYDDMVALSKLNADSCGYLRNPKFSGSTFFGGCALKEFTEGRFEQCDYPHCFPSNKDCKYKERDKCPTYNHWSKNYKLG